MTRKDYELIAAELRRSRPNKATEVNDGPKDAASHEGKHIGFALAVEAVSRALGQDNPRFDQRRFYAAVYEG